MENRSVALLIGAFVAIIIGVSLIGSVATQSNEVTERTTASQTFTGAGCFAAPVNLSGEDYVTLHTQPNGPTDADCNFTLTNVPTGWKTETANNCLLVATVSNGTSTALTLDTDYYFNTLTGRITLLNATTNWRILANNNTLVSYTYCDDDYLTEGWSRTVLDLVAGFFAIALMAIGVGLLYQVLKVEGLANL